MPRVERFFAGRFGRSIPISAFGQSPAHDRIGFDHRNAVDVALHPDSQEGQALMGYLQGAEHSASWLRQASPRVGHRSPHPHRPAVPENHRAALRESGMLATIPLPSIGGTRGRRRLDPHDPSESSWSVDDDPGLRSRSALILEDEYEVLDVPDGAQALDIVRSCQVDLVLLDIRLPGMDGLEVLERIKALDEQLDVILITAVKTSAPRSSAMKLGALDYLTKPFDEEEVLDRHPPRARKARARARGWCSSAPSWRSARISTR